MDFVAVALAIAVEAHEGAVDKAGAPYIEHPLAVAAGCANDAERAVALLHDVVEDTAVTLDDLVAAGLPAEVVAAVDAITKRAGEAYDDYVVRVAGNELARAVKIQDLAHNMDLGRLPIVGPADVARVEKYRGVLAVLLAV